MKSKRTRNSRRCRSVQTTWCLVEIQFRCLAYNQTNNKKTTQIGSNTTYQFAELSTELVKWRSTRASAFYGRIFSWHNQFDGRRARRLLLQTQNHVTRRRLNTKEQWEWWRTTACWFTVVGKQITLTGSWHGRVKIADWRYQCNSRRRISKKRFIIMA